MIKALAFLALTLTAQTAGAQQRLPFQKKRIPLQSPKNYEKRILHYDSRTGQSTYYDPKPQIVPLDIKSGTYGLRWVGFDGKEKTIIYQRPDAIDAIISASVSKTDAGQYLYIYHIKNLPSSGQYLSTFALQTFTSDARPIPINGGYVGQYSHNSEMRYGNWLGFGSTNFGTEVAPSRSVELKVISSAPPGLVECRITGGQSGMKGVGEEPPQELENMLPGYEAWPSGYTIGPNGNLMSVPREERVKDILQWLPQFKRLGWMTASVLPWYQKNLSSGHLEQVYKRAQQDLQSGNITTEVYAIIQAIRQ
ncbi:MAG: hypothetical protein ACJ74W_07910 [Pyrinomonadaceae bacterium]